MPSHCSIKISTTASLYNAEKLFQVCKELQSYFSGDEVFVLVHNQFKCMELYGNSAGFDLKCCFL